MREKNWMEWVRRMNGIKDDINEIVINEIIYL